MEVLSIFEADINGFLYAIEFDAPHGWFRLWSMEDYTRSLMVFKNSTLVLISMCNRWHNCLKLEVQIISQHIYQKGNGCENNLDNHDRTLVVSLWCDIMLSFIREDFFRDHFV